MSSYDGNILTKEGDRFMARARWIVLKYGIAGFIMGAILAFAVGKVVDEGTAPKRTYAERIDEAGERHIDVREDKDDKGSLPAALAFGAFALVFGGALSTGYKLSWTYRVQAHRLYWMVDVQLRLVGIQAGLQQRQALQAAQAPSSGHRAVRNTPPHGHTAVDTDRHR